VKTVLEIDTTSALGEPRIIKIVSEARQLYLEIHSRRGLEAIVKLPDSFFERCRVHNVEAGFDLPI
jgi:hypothetical protein